MIDPRMSRSTIALATFLTLGVTAQPARASLAGRAVTAAKPINAPPRLVHLSPAEAGALIAKLEDLQRRLKADEFVPTELLSGSIASYPMAKVSPRKAFLSLRFDQIFDIEHVGKEDDFRQPYKLTFTPNGLGHLMWFVEVDVGVNGNVERIQMLYEPPPPD
jgi:hypothetical protein